MRTLAPAQPFAPAWPTLPIETAWMAEVGFYDVCDSTEPAARTLLTEMRQVVYEDGASYGDFRLIVETPETRVFSLSYPDSVARGARSGVSLHYRQEGRVQDTSDLRQGSWLAFYDCRAGDIVEASWNTNSSGPGFSHEWQRSDADRYVLVHPRATQLYSTLPPNESHQQGNWQMDCWTQLQGDLLVSTFASWNEVARACRKVYLRHTRQLHPDLRDLALRLGSLEAISLWVTQEIQEGFNGHWADFKPPRHVLALREGSKFERTLLLCALLSATGVQSDICFGLSQTAIPGPWFRNPWLLIHAPGGPRWWPTYSRPTPYLRLSRSTISPMD